MLAKILTIFCLLLLTAACQDQTATTAAPTATPISATSPTTATLSPELTGDGFYSAYLEKLDKLFRHDTDKATECWYARHHKKQSICYEKGEIEEAFVGQQHFVYAYVVNNFDLEDADTKMQGFVRLLKFEVKTDQSDNETLVLSADSDNLQPGDGNGSKPVVNLVRINDSGERAWIATWATESDDHSSLDATFYVENNGKFRSIGTARYNYSDDRNHQKIRRNASLFTSRPSSGLTYYHITAKTFDGKSFTFQYDDATKQYTIPADYKSLFAM